MSSELLDFSRPTEEPSVPKMGKLEQITLKNIIIEGFKVDAKITRKNKNQKPNL